LRLLCTILPIGNSNYICPSQIQVSDDYSSSHPAPSQLFILDNAFDALDAFDEFNKFDEFDVSFPYPVEWGETVLVPVVDSMHIVAETTASSALASSGLLINTSPGSNAVRTSSPPQPRDTDHSLTPSPLPRNSETSTLLACSDCPHLPAFSHQHKYK
jgi:hypothetical protein